MDALTERRPPLKDGLSITLDSNDNSIKCSCKRGIVLLALWGILPPDAATRLLRRWGLRNE